MNEHAPEGKHAGDIGNQPASIFDNLQTSHLADFSATEINLGILALVERFAAIPNRIVHPDAALLFCLGHRVGEGHIRGIVTRCVARGVIKFANIVERYGIWFVFPTKPQLQPPRLGGNVDRIALVGSGTHEELGLIVEELSDQECAKIATGAPFLKSDIRRCYVRL